MKRSVIWLGAILFALAAGSAFASLRCGTKLISRGDSEAKVLHSCGQPIYAEEWRNYEGRGKRWTYYTRRGSFAKIVTIRNGKVARITSGERLP